MQPIPERRTNTREFDQPAQRVPWLVFGVASIPRNVRRNGFQNFGLFGSREAFIDGRGNCGSGGVHCGGAYSDTAQVSR